MPKETSDGRLFARAFSTPNGRLIMRRLAVPSISPEELAELNRKLLEVISAMSRGKVAKADSFAGIVSRALGGF